MPVMPESFTLSSKDGTYFRKGGAFGVQFARLLDHPASTVWKALTEPEQLAKWLAPATISGDTISLQLTGGTMGGGVIEWKENEVLEYNWHNGSVVRWDLGALEDGRCRLVFMHTNVVEAQLQGAATGWHYHMDVLEMVLGGQAAPKDAPKHWEAISRDAAIRYSAQLAVFRQGIMSMASSHR